jgi:hypothetical protein
LETAWNSIPWAIAFEDLNRAEGVGGGWQSPIQRNLTWELSLIGHLCPTGFNTGWAAALHPTPDSIEPDKLTTIILTCYRWYVHGLHDGAGQHLSGRDIREIMRQAILLT